MPASWSYILTPPEAVASSAAAVPTVDILAIKDLAVDESGDVEIPLRLVAGADAIVQRLRIRFVFWLGAWFLDLRQGLPMIEKVYERNPDLTVIETLFKRAITTCPGIAAVKAFAMAFDRRRRELRVEQFEVTLRDGSTLTLTNLPYIL